MILGFPALDLLEMRCFPLLEGDKGGGTFCFGRAFWDSPSGGVEAEVFTPLEGEESFVSAERFGFPALEWLELRYFPLLEGD